MVAKGHSHAVKLAATFLARQNSEHAAAEAFGVDRGTIRRWLDTVKVPEDQWTAIRDVLQARAAEMAAKGETRGLVQTLTGAGIAERNVRYGQLIARREARRAEEDKPEEPSPLRVQIDRLDDLRASLLATELRHELGLRAYRPIGDQGATPMTNYEADATMSAFIDDLLAMTDEQVHARHQAIDDERREVDRIEREMEEEAQRSKLRGFDHAVNVTPEQAARMVAEAEQLLLETSQ